jgi:hypothetical protein
MYLIEKQDCANPIGLVIEASLFHSFPDVFDPRCDGTQFDDATTR